MNTFGEILSEKCYSQGLTLRSLCKLLAASGSTIDLIKLSKILRGIQNPKNKQEFNELIQALNITDLTEIDNLERLAMNFIPPKKFTEQEFINSLPVFTNKINTKDLDKFIENWRKLQEADLEPE